MVAIQNNVVFWTRDYLEVSSLAGRQHVVLRMERTIAMPFPWAVGAARDGAISSIFTYSNSFLNNSSNRKKLTSLMGVQITRW